MNQNYQRNRVDRTPDNPGNRSQAAALGAAELARQTQGRSPSEDPAQGQSGQNAEQDGRGWDDLGADTLNTDQTTRR